MMEYNANPAQPEKPVPTPPPHVEPDNPWPR